jgi:hypothetical protein
VLAFSLAVTTAFSQKDFSPTATGPSNHLAGVQYFWTANGTQPWTYPISPFTSGYTYIFIQNEGPDDIKVLDSHGSAFPNCSDIVQFEKCHIVLLANDTPNDINIYAYSSKMAQGEFDLEHFPGF